MSPTRIMITVLMSLTLLGACGVARTQEAKQLWLPPPSMPRDDSARPIAAPIKKDSGNAAEAAAQSTKPVRKAAAKK